jgi:hypothetical protein
MRPMGTLLVTLSLILIKILKLYTHGTLIMQSVVALGA